MVWQQYRSLPDIVRGRGVNQLADDWSSVTQSGRHLPWCLMAYRCSHCGNRTRFDVVDTVRRRRFHHFTLGGDLTIEEEDDLESTIESVTCQRCERSDGIEEFRLD